MDKTVIASRINAGLIVVLTALLIVAIFFI